MTQALVHRSIYYYFFRSGYECAKLGLDVERAFDELALPGLDRMLDKLVAMLKIPPGGEE